MINSSAYASYYVRSERKSSRYIFLDCGVHSNVFSTFSCDKLVVSVGSFSSLSRNFISLTAHSFASFSIVRKTLLFYAEANTSTWYLKKNRSILWLSFCRFLAVFISPINMYPDICLPGNKNIMLMTVIMILGTIAIIG